MPGFHVAGDRSPGTSHLYLPLLHFTQAATCTTVAAQTNPNKDLAVRSAQNRGGNMFFSTRISVFARTFIVALCATTLMAPLAFGQATTGNITGSVITKSDGSALPGVTVEAIHVPTGTRYSAVSNSEGRFTIPNARVGGPYRVTASLEGFKNIEIANVEVRLGESTEVQLPMNLAAVSEAITVTARADDVINPNRTGSTSSVSEEQIQTLPTVNRQIQDYARTNPYFISSLTGDGSFMFVAGRN
ncbi:MAG: carboxypeptidase-like regulatory domain-containing protein, partial [Thermoanaerobaculia bacterium]